MTDSSPAHTKLRALLGDAMDDLPAWFVSRLARILDEGPAQEQAMASATARVVNIVHARKRVAGRRSRQSTAGQALERASLSRKLAGLSTIVQILDAAHHRRDDETDVPLLGTEMVEGLLDAGRELFDGVDEGLRTG